MFDVEGLRLGQARATVAVALRDALGDLERVDVLVKILARLQVEQFAGDVRDRDLEVVVALTVGEGAVHVARLGVHQVRGELRGIASKSAFDSDTSPQ